MAVQNPILNTIRQGGAAASNTLSAASRTGLMADTAFQKGASMALKMDQLLQQEESRLYNRSNQAQKMLQDGLMKAMNNQFKERAANLAEDRYKTQQDQWQKSYDLTVKRHDDTLKQQSFTDNLAVRNHNLNVNKTMMTMADKIKGNVTARGSKYSKMFGDMMKLYEASREAGLSGNKYDTAKSKEYLTKAEQYAGALVTGGGLTKAEAAQLGLLAKGPAYEDYKLPDGTSTRIARVPEDAFKITVPSTLPDTATTNVSAPSGSQTPTTSKIDTPQVGSVATSPSMAFKLGYNSEGQLITRDATGNEVSFTTLDPKQQAEAIARNNMSPVFTIPQNTDLQGLDNGHIQTQSNILYKKIQDSFKGTPLENRFSLVPKEALVDPAGVAAVLKDNSGSFNPNSDKFNPTLLTKMIKPEYALDVYNTMYSSIDKGKYGKPILQSLTVNEDMYISNKLNTTEGRNKLFETVGWDAKTVDSYVDRTNQLSKGSKNIDFIDVKERQILKNQAAANNGTYKLDEKAIKKASNIIGDAARENSAIGNMYRSTSLPTLFDWQKSGKAEDTDIEDKLITTIQNEIRTTGYSPTEAAMSAMAKNPKRYTDPNWVTSNKMENTSADITSSFENVFTEENLKEIPGYVSEDTFNQSYGGQKGKLATMATSGNNLVKLHKNNMRALIKFGQSDEYKTSTIGRALHQAQKEYIIGKKNNTIKNNKVHVTIGKGDNAQSFTFDTQTIEDLLVLKYSTKYIDLYKDK